MPQQMRRDYKAIRVHNTVDLEKELNALDGKRLVLDSVVANSGGSYTIIAYKMVRVRSRRVQAEE